MHKLNAAAALVTVLLISSVAFAAEPKIPNLVCREEKAVVVGPTLSVSEYSSTSLYRFDAKGLYLSDASRAEYFYNAVVYAGQDLQSPRFTSGHKVFQFDADYLSATVTHISSTETRVSRLRCTRT